MRITHLVLAMAAIVAGVLAMLPQPTLPRQLPHMPESVDFGTTSPPEPVGEMMPGYSPSPTPPIMFVFYIKRYKAAYASKKGALGVLEEVMVMLSNFIAQDVPMEYITAISTAIGMINGVWTALHNLQIPQKSIIARQWAMIRIRTAQEIPSLLPIHHQMLSSALHTMEMINTIELEVIVKSAWESIQYAKLFQADNINIAGTLVANLQNADVAFTSLKVNDVLQLVNYLQGVDDSMGKTALHDSVYKINEEVAWVVHRANAETTYPNQGPVAPQ